MLNQNAYLGIDKCIRKLPASTGSITNPKWEYRVYNLDGNYNVISTSTSGTFNITPLPANPNYLKSSDGDIVGEIYLEGYVNNVLYTSKLNLYLECLPGDITIQVEKRPLNSYSFMPVITVTSKGADSFTVVTDNWDDNFTFVSHFNHKNYAKGTTVGVGNYDFVIYQVIAKNVYGTKTKSYVIPDGYSTFNVQSHQILEKSENAPVYYEVKSLLNGTTYNRSVNKNELYNNLNKGMYVIIEKDIHGVILKTEKILINVSSI